MSCQSWRYEKNSATWQPELELRFFPCTISICPIFLACNSKTRFCISVERGDVRMDHPSIFPSGIIISLEFQHACKIPSLSFETLGLNSNYLGHIIVLHTLDLALELPKSMELPYWRVNFSKKIRVCMYVSNDNNCGSSISSLLFQKARQSTLIMFYK